ncbi:cupin domain-containing protein [Sphingopyxis sp.]|uniref:cupin domain-containing protein n=1 Tax=Sphingopyxis sp. TaxID=1908224 RepID=UPI0035AE7878
MTDESEMPVRAPTLYNWQDIPREYVRPGIERAGLGGEGVVCQFGWVEPGAALRPHKHDHEQIVMILEGDCIYHVGGVPHQCTRGSFVRVPPHTEHYIEVTGTETVLNLDIFAPVPPEYAHLLDHQRPEWRG